MTSQEVHLKWVEAGKILALDPAKKVSCPQCDSSYLQVSDVRNENNRSQLERILTCPSCLATNILRLTRPIVE